MWFTLASIAQSATIDGILYEAQGGGSSTIDYHSFTVNTASTITFDILAYE
jgi:hypothetical protein